MSKLADLHERWSREPEYREAYDGLGPEFELSRSLIEARTRAKLTQAELAERMQTTQSVIARLESGGADRRRGRWKRSRKRPARGFVSTSTRRDDRCSTVIDINGASFPR